MKNLNKKAFAAVEYVVLFVIVMLVFFYMRDYIQRGIFGMWGQSGKSFAFGRQYDSRRSIECGFDGQSNTWYDYNCFVTASQSCTGSGVSVGTCLDSYGQPYSCSSPSGSTASSIAICEEGIMNSTCQTNTCSQVSNGPS